jgi:glycosyltransferase involved in cell wall biosynthesis
MQNSPDSAKKASMRTRRAWGFRLGQGCGRSRPLRAEQNLCDSDQVATAEWLGKPLQEVIKEAVGLHVLLTHSLFGDGNVDLARVRIIYNGIDPEEYHPRKSSDLLPKYGIDPDKPFILFVQLNIRPEINRMIDLGAAREEITRSQYIENLVETAAREARERKTELEGARRILKSGGVWQSASKLEFNPSIAASFSFKIWRLGDIHSARSECSQVKLDIR